MRVGDETGSFYGYYYVFYPTRGCKKKINK